MKIPVEKFNSVLSSPFKWKLFLLKFLPLGFFTGLKVENHDANSVAISVKYKWLNKNPFKSLYFAVQSMAAEMSTGIVAFGAAYEESPSVSMLVTGLEAEFQSRGMGKVIFTCDDAKAIRELIVECRKTNEPANFVSTSTGRDSEGKVVSLFKITWSFKARKMK